MPGMQMADENGNPIRDLTSLGLKEAKEFTTELPKTVKDSVSKDEADAAVEQLQKAGATVKIE